MTRNAMPRNRIEWTMLGMALLILGALIGYWLYAEHGQIEVLERDRLQVQARVIDENLGRQLEGVDNALVGIRNDFPLWNGNNIGPATSHQLKALGNAMPGVRTLLILDAAGAVRATNRGELTGGNFSERAYFKVPRERPDPGVLYVSPPFETVFGVVVIAVTRAVAGPAGEFAGVVTATLDPEYFDVLLRSVLYAPDMRAVLAHWDGKAFLFMPPNPRLVGVDLARPGSFFERHRNSGQRATLFTSTSGLTGEERMMASRTFERAGLRMDKPLVIHVSRELSAIYLPWRMQALAYGLFYALICAAAMLGLYFLQQRRRAFDSFAAVHEIERRGSAERLELALGGADLGLWDWHAPSGRVIFDERWSAMLGYTLNEIEPHLSSWQALVHPDDWPAIHAVLDPHLKGETAAYESEHRMRHKDGHWVWILDRGKVMERDAAGTPVRVVGTHMNITERKRAQEALTQSEQRLRAIIDTEPECVKIVDRDGQLQEMNAAGLAMLEVESVAEAQRHTLMGFLLPEYRAAFRALHERVMRGESGMLEFEVEGLRGTRRWLETHAAPMRDGAGEVTELLGITRDITARKKAEQTHALMEAQLRESQKMEALGTLAGGVAHDFNNIIAAIMGNVELARQDVGPGHAALESLTEIRKASRRAKDLVQQILAFGRRQAASREVISLAPVVEESARLLRTTLPAGVSLTVDCEPDAPAVLADATQVEQVLLNLCGNAWQAIQGQARPGTVEIRLQAHEREAVRARDAGLALAYGEVPPGRYACLTVRDNGSGMDKETLAHMFEPFFTTKPTGKGTGLGLAVVHGILKDHGASIEVQSVPGAGSTFGVYFPTAQASAPVVQVRAPPRAPTHGQGKRVLFVDDDEAIVFLMTRLLQRQGYRISGFTDARAALAAARADPAQFDLAVTDYNMPEMSGLDLARSLREIRADLPIAVASGYITDELRAQAPAAGVNELVCKPNTVEELCEAVARLARGLRA